jgi:SAM-dependent methyltransferase
LAANEAAGQMSAEGPRADAFYTRLFTQDPVWSTRHPNDEEARRAGRILPLLSALARDRPDGLRLLDVGCGRGWLTNLASSYGECVGVDPVREVVEFARKRFPGLRFEVGTPADLVAAGEGSSYDVVIASEVIEHVREEERDQWVAALRELLSTGGAVVLTTDRGELYQRWRRREGTTEQPEENWLTEAQVKRLFEEQGFVAVERDRAYYPVPEISAFHRLVASRKLARILGATRQRWLLDGLRYLAANCQIWVFRPG